ncbi:hypothetical protein Pelo_7621 [Pelomyxa schiedti]|nr:hypothetical protein Pelo_7621 [Pelomyxa schiedti]
MLGLAMLTTNSAEQKMWAKLPGLFATLIAKPTLSSLPQSTENETEDDTVATLSSAEVRHTKSEKLHRSCPNDEHSTESCQIPQMHPHLHHRDSAYSDESIMCHNVRPVCDEECEQEEVIDCQQPAVEQQYDEFDLLCDCLSTSEPRNKYLEDSQKLQLFPPEDTEFLLPPKIFFSPKKTLVLDLDETLMHSSLEV